MKFKKLFLKLKRKITEKKIRLYRKNYMYAHVDEVQFQKVYTSNWPFYLKLILFPTLLIGIAMIIIELFCSNSEYINSIIIGILGGHLASVVVTWLADVNTCKSKTLERMRFQHVYFSNLCEICGGFIYFYVAYLVKNHPEKCKKELESAEENYKYFKGHPWQYWCSMLNDLLQQKYPFEVVIDGELNGGWITENPSKYVGVEYDILKKYIEKESEIYFSTFFDKSDFLDRTINTMTTYKSSLPDVYVNDYIYNRQLNIVNKLLNAIEDYVFCVKEKRHIEFWNANHNVLHLINVLANELYPFEGLRKTEHIYRINYYENGDFHVFFDSLDEYIDDSEDAIYGYVRRSQYRKIKKQKKYNEAFKKENQFSLDNGWR